MITLGDVPLTLATAAARETIARDLSLDRLAILFGRSWPGFGTVGLANPTGYQPWPPPVRLGSTCWPTGATRYAVSYQLATSEQADALHDAAFGEDADEAVSLDLVLSSEDHDDTPIETVTLEKMVLLPPVPLYRVLDDDGQVDLGMYLLVIVDDRFHWWDVPCPDLGINETAGKTWEDIIADLATALDVTITPGTVESGYLRPSRALNLTNEPVPLVLDSIMASIGHVLVRNFKGEITTEPFSDSLKTWQDEDTRIEAANRTIRAGGTRFMDSF